jgi:uncharacterized protein (TIGR02246 family)
MRTFVFGLLALGALAVAPLAQSGRAEDPKDKPKEEAALIKNAEGFVEAFHKGDAKALAAFWTTDGDYVDQTGKHLKGRDAIEKAFKEFFAENKELKLRIDSESLRFATPDVAVEDGVTAVIPADGGPPSRARYTIIHVKKDGQWLLSSVRDSPFATPSNYEHLRDLEWVIGDWVDAAAEKGEVGHAVFSWSENQNYILSSFATSFKNIALHSGTQRIGWDPAAKGIRSWTFDDNGAFGEATWSKDGDKWQIKTQTVLRDGKKMTATDVVTRIDADTLGWQSKERMLDGKALPDVKEIKMKRVK